MRVVAYSVELKEKKPIALANRKKHEITLVANPLTDRSVTFAKGKEAVVVSSTDDLSDDILRQLSEMGVRFIITRSFECLNIDLEAARRYLIHVSNVHGAVFYEVDNDQLLTLVAEQTISLLDHWQSS